MSGSRFLALSCGSVRSSESFTSVSTLKSRLTYLYLATLVSMIITWKAMGEPHYVSQDSNMPYISDIGADILKPLFITGGSITAVSFFLSLVVERWLRHSGRCAMGVGCHSSEYSCKVVTQIDPHYAATRTSTFIVGHPWLFHRRIRPHTPYDF
jgi:hypothetical protein